MKLIIIKTNLKEALINIGRAVGESLNLPVLKNVLLEVRDNEIKLTATNLEIAINHTLTGKIIEDGDITVPYSVFLNLIANIPTERLNLETKKNTLEIKTDNYQGSVTGLPAQDFPLIPKIKNKEEYIEIKGEILTKALTQTTVATHPSDLHPELNSVLFDFNLESIKFAATDSFRLAEKTITTNDFSSTYVKKFKALLPLKTAQEISRITHNQEKVKIYYDSNQILFKTDTFKFTSRLVEGVFPDYLTIIPKEFSAEVVFQYQEFINALKLTGVLGNKSGEVKIRTLKNKKTVEVFSIDQSVGENSYFLPVKIQGEIEDMVFNWRYIIDGLKALSGEEVFMGINKDNKPAILKNTKDTSYFYMVAPVFTP